MTEEGGVPCVTYNTQISRVQGGLQSTVLGMGSKADLMLSKAACKRNEGDQHQGRKRDGHAGWV